MTDFVFTFFELLRGFCKFFVDSFEIEIVLIESNLEVELGGNFLDSSTELNSFSDRSFRNIERE